MGRYPFVSIHIRGFPLQILLSSTLHFRKVGGEKEKQILGQ